MLNKLIKFAVKLVERPANVKRLCVYYGS
jgi:hypothetical protein